MKYITIISIWLNAFFCNSQIINLSDSISDYGYGLVKRDIKNDSIFDYTRIYNLKNEISYTKIKDTKSCKIKFYKKKGFFNKIGFKGKKICFENNYNLDTVISLYSIMIKNKKYYLVFICNSKIADLRNQLLGFLIDDIDNKIYLLPELQSSDSPLCIMDLDNNEKIEYLSYNPSNKETIDIYSLEGYKFNKKFTYKLDEFDGYVWKVNMDSFNESFKNIYPAPARIPSRGTW